MNYLQSKKKKVFFKSVKPSETPTYKDYVQDGLVCQFDGIQNTLNGHSNTTRIWYDLTKNYDAVLIGNTDWNEKGFDFGSSYFNFELPLSNYYVEVCFETPEVNNEGYIISGFVQLYIGNVQIYKGCLNFKYNERGLKINANEINTVSSSLYKNCVKQNNQTTTMSMSQTSKRVIGAYVNGTLKYFGKVYSIRFYDRTLSSAETIKIQKIDMQRFEIS